MARNAQESLAQLEKDKASIQEQLQQAASFAGISFEKLRSDLYLEESRPAPIHGREDWTFKWLLRKLSSNKDVRSCPDVWRLFAVLARRMPVRNVARVMNERRFMTILREALEELTTSSNGHLNEKEAFEKSKSSKKRKRGEDLIVKAGDVLNERGLLQAEIHVALQTIISLSRSEEAFDAEYLKSTLRTSNEEAAKILGGWLTSFEKENLSSPSTVLLAQQLEPFIEVWTLRISGSEDPVIFSKYCLQPSVHLLMSDSLPPAWCAQLEETLALNVVIPARTAYLSESNTDVFKALVENMVTEHPEAGPIIFELTTRCLPPRGESRRRNFDEVWLHSVFDMIKNVIRTTDTNSRALGRLLQICSQYHVLLELPVLRSIISEHAFVSPKTNWDIVVTVLKLDSNVFLIKQSDEDDLLEQLLSRITHACLLSSWPKEADQVIDDVVVPLMSASAKARDLIGFIHRWHAQLVEYEQKIKTSISPETCSAWEDSALLNKLKDIMEASLTREQIVQVVEWIEGEVQTRQQSILVIAEAISGAVRKEDVIDAVGTRLYQLNSTLEYEDGGLSGRHDMRLWRVASNTLNWCSSQDVHQMRSSLAASIKKAIGNDVSQYGTGVHLQAFRCLLQFWTRSSEEERTADGLDALVQSNQHGLLKYLSQNLMDLQHEQAWGNDRWDRRLTTMNMGKAWFTCQYLQCMLVEHPDSSRLMFKDVSTIEPLKMVIWAASASTPSTTEHSSNAWLRCNHDVLPSMWMAMLQSDSILNDSKATGAIIQLMLDCGTHSDNPIESSPAFNGFVIKCLHQLPIEVFSRSARERVVTSWPAQSQHILDDNGAALSYKMEPLDPAILSLKVKMMRRPTLYQGIHFQDSVDLAESVALLSSRPQTLLPIFATFVHLTLSHFMGTIDQAKSQEYLQNMFNILERWVQDNVKAKEPPSFTMIRLFQVALVTLSSKIAFLESSNVLTGQRLTAMRSSFKKMMVNNFTRLLQKPKKLKKDADLRSMSFISTISALRAIQLEKEDLELFTEMAVEQSILSLEASNAELGRMAKAYIVEQTPSAFASATVTENLGGAVFSDAERQAIHRKASSFADHLDKEGKLTLAGQLLEEGLANKTSLDKLLAFKDVIMSCEDSRNSTHDNIGSASISSLFTALTSKLWKAEGFRQFCIISELMELILRTKGRSMVQYNIDSTLSSISIVCSRSGPSLSSRRAGTIYLHLCRLMQAVLVSHRLKLQGHFHLVVQTMQSLLHCLFIPISFSQRALSRMPPWLSDPSPCHQLRAAHSVVYTRLLTLICDPSVSSVSRGGSANTTLSSATAKAERLAAQHMPLVLSAYIHLQLDMALRLQPEVRAKLVPGFYAVLDTTSRDGRRVLGESLDASGRAVLAAMVRDWQRFGRWKGL